MVLIGCSHVGVLDQKSITRGHYDDLVAPMEDADDEDVYECMVEENDDVTPVWNELASLCVVNTNQISEILLSLCKKHNININIIGDINAHTLTLSAKDRSLKDIVADISHACSLRYQINANNLIIERDNPYTKTYNVQFLNIMRSSESEISNNTDIFSRGESKTSDNGSSSVVKSMSESDFWGELQQSVRGVLHPDDSFSLHKQAGLLSVTCCEREHKKIAKIINNIQRNTQTQVLIEAKIVEINLNNEYQAGIDWALLFRYGSTLGEMSINSSLAHPIFKFNSRFFSATMHFLERFGTVKTIASPRITVLNNQTSMMKVAQNEVIYKTELQRTYASTHDSRNGDTLFNNIQTIPVGLMMTVHPVINYDTGEIMLTIRPTISRIAGYKEVQTAGVLPQGSSIVDLPKQKIPIIDVREIDSVLKMKSGEVVILGGLMQERSANNSAALPGCSSNVLSAVLGHKTHDVQLTELVILLRAKIVKSTNYAMKDKYLYDKFVNDARPFRMNKCDSANKQPSFNEKNTGHDDVKNT